jgi:hypothetical protein
MNSTFARELLVPRSPFPALGKQDGFILIEEKISDPLEPAPPSSPTLLPGWEKGENWVPAPLSPDVGEGLGVRGKSLTIMKPLCLPL